MPMRKIEALQMHKEKSSVKPSRVCFKVLDEPTDVHPTFSRRDLTPEEAQDIWFSKKDIKAIAKRNKNLALVCAAKHDTGRRHSLGSLFSNEENLQIGRCSCISAQSIAQSMGETCRGLENLIFPFRRRVTRESKRGVRDCVLFEQSRQLSEGELNPLLLAQVSITSSSHAQARALEQGRLDAELVFDQKLSYKGDEFEDQITASTADSSSSSLSQLHFHPFGCICKIQTQKNISSQYEIDLNNLTRRHSDHLPLSGESSTSTDYPISRSISSNMA